MYYYVITNFADEEIFYKQCQALEKHIPGLQAEKLLEDVDGKLIQIYHHPKGRMEVWNDVQENGVDIRSDFDVDPYFGIKREEYKFQNQDTVRIRETGCTGKIINIYHRINGDVRYDVEGHRKVVRNDDKEILYCAEELEKIN